MSSPALEAFLARLYTDEAALQTFLQTPDETARAAGLDAEAVAALRMIDRTGLAMAARSFRAKRAGLARPRRLSRLWSRLCPERRRL
jgi:hypothetical protein